MTSTLQRITHTFRYGEHDVTFETGELARQASGAVLVSMSGTVVLATVVATREPAKGKDFLPLTINYQEKFYAAGRIPGGFFKREGRPSERETLTSRLIDRPLRPLFPEGFCHDVQIVVTVLSRNPQIDADIPGLLGASAALAISGIPFNGPIGAAKVGYVDGQYVLNPTAAQLESSALELVVAGTRHAVLMVESEAKLLSEEAMLGAVLFGQRANQQAISAIHQLAKRCAPKPWAWSPPDKIDALDTNVQELADTKLTDAFRNGDRLGFRAAAHRVRDDAIEKLQGEWVDRGWTEGDVARVCADLEYRVLRREVLDSNRRVDGRGLNDIRPIATRVGVLPRTHGSALFTRGETQALVIATLGTTRDAQIIDAMEGESKDPFLFHYNFPPYCVGEVGFMTGPKRREIGHGRLAKRGVAAVMPTSEQFPYVVRIVSEITESNGSSSMASVCGSSLALMDAGAPIKAPVAGIAMGLIKEGERFAVLSDILGDEDHLGDMDFKVAGTADGISALQMDIKIDGITEEIMQVALERAREGRLHILAEMAKTIATPREQLSEFAPRLLTMKIPTERIRDLIGKGGITIRTLSAETGTTIDVKDDGTVTIASSDGCAAGEARRRVNLITSDIEPGMVYEGTVARLMDFGAFVTILPGRDGLVHISQISVERVERVSDRLKEGDIVKVKVLEVDRQGRVRLSMRAVEEAEVEATA